MRELKYYSNTNMFNIKSMNLGVILGTDVGKSAVESVL